MSFDQHPITLLNREGAPDFITAEAEQLLAQAITYFEQATGRTLAPSQVEMYLIETIAYMLTLRGAEEQLAFENNLVAFARGPYLDLHGADRNTPRLEATRAKTELRFTASPAVAALTVISAGTRVSDPAVQAQFRTVEQVHLDTGETNVIVRAEAVDPGIGANGIDPGKLTNIIDPIAGITAVTNLVETDQGAERETDARYRARIALASERISRGGTRQSYLAHVLGWSASALDAAIIRSQPGHIDIHPLMVTGAPSAAEKAALLDHLEGKIPQGDYVSIRDPTSHDFSFTLHLVINDPDAVSLAEAAVLAVLDAWKETLGGFITPSDLKTAAKFIDGIVDADTPDLAFVQVPGSAWRNCTGFTTTTQAV